MYENESLDIIPLNSIPYTAFTGNNDEVLKKYKEVLSEIKSCIEKINNNKSR